MQLSLMVPMIKSKQEKTNGKKLVSAPVEITRLKVPTKDTAVGWCPDGIEAAIIHGFFAPEYNAVEQLE